MLKLNKKEKGKARLSVSWKQNENNYSLNFKTYYMNRNWVRFYFLN